MLASIFTVLTTAAVLARGHDQVYYDTKGYNDGQFGVLPTNYYHSTEATSPKMQVNTWNKSAMSKSGSYIVLQHDKISDSKRAGKRDLNSSPLILRTKDLSAVYTNRSFPGVANVNVQTYEDKPILSFYGGPLEDGTDIGNGYIFGYDQEYREVGHLAARHLKVGVDPHEFVMTGKKTAIVTAYETIKWDLRPHGGDEDGSVLDSIFQEIDLINFKVLFEWRASEHISMDLSYKPLGDSDYGWDFFHITSVQKSQKGDYLVSGANMHSIYMIDGKTGSTKWTLGGKGNDFREIASPEGSHFSAGLLSMAWQHHAQFYPGKEEREFTVFDNHGISINGWGCTSNCSRGLHFKLDPGAKTAQLLNEYLHPAGLWSISQGSVQVLDNGNVFIGWGRNPAMTEHLPDGDCVFDVQFSPWRSPATEWKGLDSYRAYRVDWAGMPHWTPDIAADKAANGDLTAWVSWNGATEVREWVLLGSKKEMDLNGPGKVVSRAQWDGFETVLWAEKTNVRYLRAVAIGAGGQILRASGIWDTRYNVVKPADYPVTAVEEQQTKGGTKGGLKGGQKDQGGSKSGNTGADKAQTPGLPEMTYYEQFPKGWSFGGLALGVSGFALGVWVISRLL